MDWIKTNKECPHCGSTDTEMDTSMILTCLPPKSQYRCKSCEKWFTLSDEAYDTLRDSSVNYGWVCPKCGRVNAPFVRTCDCTNSGLTWTTVTCDSNSITTSNINEQMKQHFLNESESVFEAVDKYKEWERKQEGITSLINESIDD